MKQEVADRVRAMIKEESCCKELKAAGQEWLDSLGTDREKETGKKLVAELEADLMPVDRFIGFLSTGAGVKMFGREPAEAYLAHAKEIKAKGEKWCDCPACTAAKWILEHKESIL